MRRAQKPPELPWWDVFAEGPGGVVLKAVIQAESGAQAREVAVMKPQKWEPVDESDLPENWPPPDDLGV